MLELRFVPAQARAFTSILQELADRGHRRVVWNSRSELAKALAPQVRDLRLHAIDHEAEPIDAAPEESGKPGPLVLVTETDPGAVASALLRFIDLPEGCVIAPRTKLAFDQRPLFLISIPKAGTHLLYSLAEVFGYHAGIICPDTPRPGCWYCLEYSNSHTRAPDFFIDSVRRSPFGNRHHAFARSPALFIYRNPLDILVSEANYYHRDGNTIFAGYLGARALEERLLVLIEDPWLLGSFRDRMAGFVAWLEFPNVIPVSFEELIGSRGGGDDPVQQRLIWSLQLKLQVPGKPADFAAQIFDPGSPTFHAGQIGLHETKMSERVMAKFAQIPQDFMEAFGYTLPGRGTGKYPRRSEEFRKRRLVTADHTFDDTPILIKTEYLGYSIVRYRSKFFGVLGEDLLKLDEQGLRALPSATTMRELERTLSTRGWPRRWFGFLESPFWRLARRRLEAKASTQMPGGALGVTDE